VHLGRPEGRLAVTLVLGIRIIVALMFGLEVLGGCVKPVEHGNHSIDRGLDPGAQLCIDDTAWPLGLEPGLGPYICHGLRLHQGAAAVHG
jgi:hypothetical protein